MLDVLEGVRTGVNHRPIAPVFITGCGVTHAQTTNTARTTQMDDDEIDLDDCDPDRGRPLTIHPQNQTNTPTTGPPQPQNENKTI